MNPEEAYTHIKLQRDWLTRLWGGYVGGGVGRVDLKSVLEYFLAGTIESQLRFSSIDLYETATNRRHLVNKAITFYG
jgi:hypothetical protein